MSKLLASFFFFIWQCISPIKINFSATSSYNLYQVKLQHKNHPPPGNHVIHCFVNFSFSAHLFKNSSRNNFTTIVNFLRLSNRERVCHCSSSSSVVVCRQKQNMQQQHVASHNFVYFLFSSYPWRRRVGRFVFKSCYK